MILVRLKSDVQLEKIGWKRNETNGMGYYRDPKDPSLWNFLFSFLESMSSNRLLWVNRDNYREDAYRTAKGNYGILKEMVIKIDSPLANLLYK